MAEVRDFEKMSSTGSNRRRACRYLKDGEKFFTYLNVLLERLEKAASASPGVTDDTIIVEKTVREVKTINLKPAERQQIDSHFVELIEVAKRKVARVKELMVYGDGGSSLTQVDTTSSSKQEEAEQPKCKRLYDDGRPLLNSTDCQLLLHQRLNSYRKEMLNESINQQKIVNFNNNNSLEHPVPSTSKEADNFSHNEPPANSTVAPLPPNATPKQIFALLLSLEEEHFRAASFERAVQAASDTLSVLTGGVCVSGCGNFGVITATLVGELKEYRQTLDDRQIVDVIGAFNAAFTGLRETVPTAYSHHQNTLGAPSKPTDPPEIVDYLVALAALLTATSQLRPAAADVLRSLFTSSVDQLVLYTAGQLSLLTGDLLAPSSTVLQSKSNPLEQQDHHAYRCLVDGALLFLGRIFSHRSPIDGLGAKVGGEALNALLAALLPFYVLRLGFCHRHTSLYQPVEKFAEGRLFHGRTEREIATMAKYDETINKLTPVNCTALLTVLLRLLVRLTTEPMAVMAEVLMVPPSALEGPVSAAQEEVNQQPLFRSPLNANFNMSSVEEARIMAKTLLNTFWEKAGKLLRQMELSKWIENRGTAFKTTIEEMLWQLHLLFESYSDPPNTDHLNKEMVALANDTAGRALSYMAKNLGPRIWYYFGKVNKELDKRPFKDAVVGGCGGTSVMVAYLNSLSLGRPVELEEEEDEEVVVGESDVEEDNGDENENEIYDDDAADAESDEKCLVEEEKVPKDDQNDLNAGELEETAPVEKSSSSHLQSSAEQALATFSTSMLRMASQMINSVELFVKDIAQIEECLKNQRQLATPTTSKEASEPMAVDESSGDSGMNALQPSSIPSCSPSITAEKEVSAQEKAEQLNTNSNGKRSREDAAEEKQHLQEQQTESINAPKKAIEVISIDSGDDDPPKATSTVPVYQTPPSLSLPCPSKKVRFSLSCPPAASLGPSPPAILTTTIDPVIEEDVAAAVAGGDVGEEDSDADDSSAKVMLELKEMQKKMASYEQTIAKLLEKLESKDKASEN